MRTALRRRGDRCGCAATSPPWVCYFLPEASGAEIMHTSQLFYSFSEHRNVPRGGNRPAFRNALASCKTLETSTAHGERLIRRNAVYSRSNRALFFISDHDCDAQKPRHGCLAPRCATALRSASTKLQPLDAVAAPLSPSLRLPRYCTLQAPAAAAA